VHQGKVIQGSGAILSAICELFNKSRLQPWLQPGSADDQTKQRASELEELADRSFGAAIQAFGYDILLRDRPLLIDLWNHRGPWWGRLFYGMAFSSMERALRKGYCRSPEHIEQSRVRFLDAFDRTDAILDKQPYLISDVPTRPDLAVAALLSPVVRPKEHPMPWPDYPEPLETFCRELKGRPTFTFVERLYREHRHP
jgi:glutathione S-transferase